MVVLLLPVALLVGLVIAASVIIDSPGSVLYRSRRVGRGGQDFDMLKFRTMTRETSGGGLRVRGDARQTPLGRMLSMSHLDELPQLWNVLRGDMSLVGPRPEAQEFVDEQPAAYELILQVRPGLTGPTQLAFLDEGARLARIPATLRRDFYVATLLPDKVASDLAYVRRRTITGDLGWLVRTLIAPALSPRRYGRRASRRVGRLARVTLVGAPFCLLPVLYAAQIAAPVV